MKQQHTDNYEDIIHLPHPVSKKHAQMPIRDRAAQFAPFAALTGHKEAIQQAQRLIDQRKVLDENRNMQNDESLQEILQHITEQPRIRVTYFQPDERKDGGAYRTLIMYLKKMDEYNRRLIFSDHSWIPLDDIYEIELLLER